jgi:hypothetical protein
LSCRHRVVFRLVRVHDLCPKIPSGGISCHAPSIPALSRDTARLFADIRDTRGRS